MSPKVIVKGSPVHRVWQVVGYGIVLLAALWVAYQAPNYLVPKFSIGVTYALAILGLNLVTGYSGQVSLGHSAFFGVGAYATGILMNDHGWPFLLTVPFAAALGLLIGFLVGLPALRIRGLYLALVTLAIAIVFPVLVKKFDSLTGGSNGLTLESTWDPPSWVPGNVTRDVWTFMTVFAITCVMFLLASNLIRSRMGRGLIAVRDNEIGAAVSGVYPAGFKTGAFAFSAAFAGVAGSLYALTVGTLSPDAFGLVKSIEFIAGLVVGGVATIVGSAIGGMIIEFLPYYTSSWLEGPRANILLGVFLIAVIFVAPGGIMWLVRLLRSKVVVFVPRLPKISSAPTGGSESPPAAPVPAASVPQPQGGDA